MGDLSTPDLLSVAALKLWTVGEFSDAAVLSKYARVQEENAWETDQRVWDLLRRLASEGDHDARELAMRLKGKRGFYDTDAAADYWRLYAADCREAGNYEAARLGELIAGLPDGGRSALGIQWGCPMDRRIVRAQRRLSQYERETAGLSPEEEFDKASRLAEAEGSSLHDYRSDLAKARTARAKLYSPD